MNKPKCKLCEISSVFWKHTAFSHSRILTAADISVLEDYPQGYPRLAAFLALDRDFTVFKRFDYLHMRSLLEQQDELAELQERLERCDDADPIRLGLSSRRQDENAERRDLLRQVQAKLQEYDRGVQDCHAMLRLPEAHDTQKQNVENWCVGNKPLVRSESACYVDCTRGQDYVALMPKDTDRAGLETLVDLTMRTCPNVARHAKTRDRNIFVFPPNFLNRIVKILFAIFIPLWLVFPTILLYNATSHGSSAIIYAIFTFWTSFIVISMANVTKYDLTLALIT
ncbi:hypothetical protein BDR22DRAFT_809198 [Usnea florida]